MKQISWIVKVSDNGIAIVEHAEGFPDESVSSHLEIIGIIEDIKRNHLNRLNPFYNKTRKANGETKDNL